MLKKKKQIEAKEAKKKQAAKLDELIAEKETEPTCSAPKPVKTEHKSDYCNDLAKLENLYFGRMSFNGFNKEVEVEPENFQRKS